MDSEIIGAIISAIATIIVAIIGGRFAIKIKDMEIATREAKTGELVTQAEKKAAHWLWGIIGAGVVVAIGIAVTVLLGNLSFFSPLSPTAIEPYSQEPMSQIENLCPDTVPRSMVSTWGIGAINVDDVQSYLNRYETYRKEGGGFVQGDTIPSGVVIATDFGNGESETWQTYPVEPIVHYRSWGLFEVTRSFSAENEGSCITIVGSKETSSLIINGISYSLPTDSEIRCIAREQTEYTQNATEYNISVPEGWLIVWDSWKAYWPGGQYENDGLLGVYGNWNGTISIMNGEYCAVPVEWATFAINDRRSAMPRSNRPEFYIGETP